MLNLPTEIDEQLGVFSTKQDVAFQITCLLETLMGLQAEEESLEQEI